MKVLMTADTLGGVWTFALELARAAPDINFVIASMGKMPDAAQLRDIERLPNSRLIPAEWKLEWMDDPWDEVTRAGAWLLDLEEHESPDVVHLNGFAHGALPFRSPKIVVGHSCVMSWWQAVKADTPPAEWNRYRETVERGLGAADLVLAPSDWMLARLKQHYRFKTPSAVIYNGRRFFPAVTPGAQSTVFSAGRMWDEAKNLRTVLAAAPRLAWPVRIAGEGGEDASNVTYLGRLTEDDMGKAYAAAGIYLFPAIYEPFGLSVLEAALSGCALILGDIGSLHEIWGDSAIYVPPRDIDAIVETVNMLIAEQQSRVLIAARARERAAMYTPSRMAAGYREAYRALMPRRPLRATAPGAWR